MRVHLTLAVAALTFWGTAALAQQSMTFDWEDGVSTALGINGNAVLENSGVQAQNGSRSLRFSEDPLSGTPQAYIWWITGCVAGDVIDASFYVYDTTVGTDPSGRIWAHYTDNTNVLSYTGSASGNNTYSAGTGWSQLSYQWTYANSGDDYGFVVEARIYSSTGLNVIYIDNAYISTSSNTAVIHNASGAVPVELASLSASATQQEVELTWSTASELNNLGFNILRALGSGERAAIGAGLIQGAGTTLVPQRYTYVDAEVCRGLTYRYWLEQVDFQGTTAMFGPVTVQVPADLPGVLTLAVSPAPVQDAAQIQLHVPRDGMARVGLYDLQGRQVRTVWSGPVQAGATMVSFKRDGLGSGLYVLRAITSCGLVSQAVVLD